MRKWFVFFLLLSLLLFPTLAEAQSGITIKELRIQLWPEYDHPDMLVMHSFSLTEDSILPAEFQFRIPANADLTAVAKTIDNSMVNVPYDASEKDGDWIIITMLIDDLASYRVEYYLPLEKNGASRVFSYSWQSNYHVQEMFLQFQQPPGSSNLNLAPTFPTTTTVADGSIYHDLIPGSVAGGEIFTLSISYEKANDELTVSTLPVEVGGVAANDSDGFSVSNSLPTILVGSGVLLIVGGLLYFFMAGRSSDRPQKSRKRHAPSTAAAGGNIYCHKCGTRARSGDKFCRSCGARTRT